MAPPLAVPPVVDPLPPAPGLVGIPPLLASPPAPLAGTPPFDVGMVGSEVETGDDPGAGGEDAVGRFVATGEEGVEAPGMPGSSVLPKGRDACAGEFGGLLDALGASVLSFADEAWPHPSAIPTANVQTAGSEAVLGHASEQSGQQTEVMATGLSLPTPPPQAAAPRRTALTFHAQKVLPALSPKGLSEMLERERS